MPKVPRPALPGFHTDVTLSTGMAVRLRKVDLTAMQSATSRDLIMGAYAQAGRDHAEAAGEFLRRVMKEQESNPAAVPDELMKFPDLLLGQTRASDLALLRAACVEPTLDGLIELYQGDAALPDLGLGPDYSLLLAYVRQHSRLIPPDAREVAQATTFPDGAGRDAPRDGQGLRRTAKRPR